MSLIHAFAERTRNLTLREEDEGRGCDQALRRVPVQIGDVVQQLPMPVARIQLQQGPREFGSPFDARLLAAPDGHRRERKTERLLVQNLGEIPTPVVDGIERFVVATVDLCGQEAARLRYECFADFLSLAALEGLGGIESQSFVQRTRQQIELDVRAASNSRIESIDAAVGLVGCLDRPGHLIQPGRHQVLRGRLRYRVLIDERVKLDDGQRPERIDETREMQPSVVAVALWRLDEGA